MAQLPFSVFRRAGRRYYSVSFKNETTGKYLPAISTKQQKQDDAITTAFQWLKDGIPKPGGPVSVKKYSLRDMAKDADISAADCEFICRELKRRGLLKSFCLAETKQAVLFTEYLVNFWDWEQSDYIREKLRKSHGIHRYYCRVQFRAVNTHWKSFFTGRFLGEITKQDINDFMNSLASKNLSPSRINHIIKAGTVPLKWAFR